jgi:hypothetical protein
MSRINIKDIGPAPEPYRCSFLESFFAYSRPTLMVRTGCSTKAQTEALSRARQSLHLDESTPCVRARELAGICAGDLLDDETKRKFEGGDAILVQPPDSHRSRSELETNRLFFIDELLDDVSDYPETVLFPDVAAALESFFLRNFRSEAVIDIDWGRIQQAERKINCTAELLQCIRYVQEKGKPLLLVHCPNNYWDCGPRLLVYSVDHWIVSPQR